MRRLKTVKTSKALLAVSDKNGILRMSLAGLYMTKISDVYVWMVNKEDAHDFVRIARNLLTTGVCQSVVVGVGQPKNEYSLIFMCEGENVEFTMETNNVPISIEMTGGDFEDILSVLVEYHGLPPSN